MPRNYQHKKRGKTLNYDPKQLEKALEAHNNGTSFRKAASLYNVPKSTLADRATGKLPLYARHGRPTAIPDEIEKKMVESVKAAAEKGIGISRKQLLLRTNILCKRVKVHPSYQNFKAGKNWWEGMKRRHNLSLRKPERLGTTRCRMMNREVVKRYFESLEVTMKNLGLDNKPEQIWNCDETSKNFEHDPVRVVAGTGVSGVCGRTSAKSTNITIMACVNAAGSSMPPMFVVKGKTPRSLYSFNTQAAPVGTKWSFQEKGWMTDVIGEQWFDNIFLENCGPNRPQLLILDGHSSHESLAILQRAIEEDIHIFALPPHTTHHLQPLDKAVFGPFNKAYNSACSEFLQDPMHTVNKWSFPVLINRAWEASFTEGNIRSGFAVCGIYPLNKNAIPSQAFAPSIPTDKPFISGDHCQNQPSETRVDLNKPTPAGDNSPLNTLAASGSTINSRFESNPSLYQRTIPIESPIDDKSITHVSSFAIPTATLSSATDATDVSGSTIDASVVLEMLCDGNLLVEEDTSIITSENPLNDVEIPPTSFLTCNESLNNTIVPSKCLENIVDYSTVANWNKAVDDIFLPPSSNVSETKTKRKSITSHRLLTSQEIIQEKVAMEKRKLQKQNKSKKKL